MLWVPGGERGDDVSPRHGRGPLLGARRPARRDRRRHDHARLAAELVEHDEVDAFGDHLDVLVAQLLAACDVPVTHDGDTAEWIAAAVIARGRGDLRAHARRRRRARPGRVGAGPRPGACSSWACRRRPAPPHGGDRLTLQWKSRQVPVGVETLWDPEHDEHGDDPAFGLRADRDEAWDAALGVLTTDAEFQRRRAALEPVALHVVVRDVEELELSAWPDPDAVESVVLARARVPGAGRGVPRGGLPRRRGHPHDRRPGGAGPPGLTGHSQALPARRPGTPALPERDGHSAESAQLALQASRAPGICARPTARSATRAGTGQLHHGAPAARSATHSAPNCPVGRTALRVSGRGPGQS